MMASKRGDRLMRKIMVFLMVVTLVGLTGSAFAQTSGTKVSAVYTKLREVDSRLERAFHDLRAVEALVYKNRPGQFDANFDQALRSLAEGLQKVDQALGMVRAMKPKSAAAAPPAREQLDRVERTASDAVKAIRDAKARMEGVKVRPEDASKISLMLKLADSNADAAAKMLRQIIASL